MCWWHRYHVSQPLFVDAGVNITRLVQQVSVVFTQRDRRGGIRGKLVTTLPQISSNEVGYKSRGGRIPFCASAMLSTRMCQGFAGWHARRPMPWHSDSSIVFLSVRRLVKFGSSLSVKGFTLQLSMRWSTRMRHLNPQNKHQVIRVKISFHNRQFPLLL